MAFTAQAKIELFAANAQTAKSQFPWNYDLTRKMAALLYAQHGRTIDCDAIRTCVDLIKGNTGAFSAFRGDLILSLAALLSLCENPRAALGQTLRVYDMLKATKLRSSNYLVIAAYQIASQSDEGSYERIAERTRAFYDAMKAYHFFYTGEDDYIFAAMLGLSDIDADSGSQRIEQYFLKWKDSFWDKNSVQTLAQVLVLGSADEQINERISALRDAFNREKIKLDKSCTLPLLGIFALLPAETSDIVSDLNAAQAYLRKQKSFGSLSIATQELLVFASSMIAHEYAQGVKDGVLTAALSTSITNIILAEQAAMIACIAASSAAATAAAST